MGRVWASDSLGIMCGLPPSHLGGSAPPSLPAENAELVSGICDPAAWPFSKECPASVKEMGLVGSPLFGRKARGALSGSLCFLSSLASSRTGRCMSTSKSTVQGRRISMEMALPYGIRGTALCQVGRRSYRWGRSAQVRALLSSLRKPGPSSLLWGVSLCEEGHLDPVAQLIHRCDLVFYTS